MSRVHDPTAKSKAGVLLALPPIALSELKEPTKDFLLAKANAGATPLETMKELLDRGAERAGFRAERAGFRAKRAAAAEASRQAEAWAEAGGLEAGTLSVAHAHSASNNTNADYTAKEGGDEHR